LKIIKILIYIIIASQVCIWIVGVTLTCMDYWDWKSTQNISEISNPIEKKVIDNVEPMKYNSGLTESEKECLAIAVYGEARGESKMGQLLVMDVINNRKESADYPNHICDVIKQKKQFSFWSGSWVSPKELGSYNKIKNLVEDFDPYKGISKGSMWYHGDHIKPSWTRWYKQSTHVGNHIFYIKKEAI
jgi:spore germination cell wall hydrolase CwlJ-like protein